MPNSLANILARARAAQAKFSTANQDRVDEAVTALAWSLFNNADILARQAVEETGLGNIPDKITKKRRKTLGTLRDLLRVRSVGVIEDNPERGIVKYAKPVGVVAAITPATNPGATPVNKAMMALKGRNAIIIAPSPAAWNTTATAVELMRCELERIGLPADLVQVLPQPITRIATSELMQAADLVIATGSQANVRQAYSSGTPAIGVGAGNVPVIIDETADLGQAAARIAASKIFDNSTSCSSENAVVLLDEVYESALAALIKAGGFLANADQKARIAETLWHQGKLDRSLVARDASVLAERWDLGAEAAKSRFFLVEDDGIGPDYPFSGEKLSLVLTVYRARDFDHAITLVRDILAHQGRGHSCGIHTTRTDRARVLADSIDVVRVLVNQAHTFSNGGGFENGLNFTLSMGCGTWGGNSISENLAWHHFVNVTHLVTPIPTDQPQESQLFAAYWNRYGK